MTHGNTITGKESSSKTKKKTMKQQNAWLVVMTGTVTCNNVNAKTIFWSHGGRNWKASCFGSCCHVVDKSTFIKTQT